MDTLQFFDHENSATIGIETFKAMALKAPWGVLLSQGANLPIVYANPAFSLITGYSLEEVLGRNCSFLQGTDREQPAISKIRDALRDKSPFEGVLRNYRKDGSLFYNHLRIDPIYAEDGSFVCFVGYQQDVTQERRRTLFLEMLIGIGEMLNDSLYEMADESVLDLVTREISRLSLFHIAAVSQVENSCSISYLSASGPGVPSVVEVCGNPDAGPCPLTLSAWNTNEISFDNHYPDHPERVSIRQVMIDEKWYSGAVIPIVSGGKVTYALGLVSALYGVFDSEMLHGLRRIKTMVEEFLKRKAEFLDRKGHTRRDPLTGLLNRLAFGEIVADILSRTRHHNTITAIVYVDLDGFKLINDNHGHEAGDRVLSVVGERILASVREKDAAVRLGGDEFLLLLEGINSLGDLEEFLIRFSQVLEEPISWKNLWFRVRASFGVTLFPQDSGDVDVLLHHADQAMYAHKRLDRDNRGPFVLYPPLELHFRK